MGIGQGKPDKPQGQHKMTALNRIKKNGWFVGVKQGSSALPAFDLRGNQGKAGEAFALPLRNRVHVLSDPAEAGRAGV
jgi:hypothetical protein